MNRVRESGRNHAQENIGKERLIGLPELLAGCGLILVGWGLWLISLPAFLLGSGITLLAAAWLLLRYRDS